MTVYPHGSIYVKDDRIAEIGAHLDGPYEPECVVVDAEGSVVLPGFVNAHAHLQQYLRGVYELVGDFYRVSLPLEGYRQPDDMEDLGLASCAELIYGGCTTSQIIYTYPDGFARAVEKAGNRCIVAADIEEVNLTKLAKGVYEYVPKKGTTALKRASELYGDWHGRADGRITAVMAPKAPDFATAETYLKCKEFADRCGLRMTTHLSQSCREVEQVKRRYGKTPTQHLQDLGILGDALTGAHCSYLTDDDTRLIAESGMGILHCRAIENPLAHWIDMGIPIGLGTDDYNHNMLQLARQNLRGLSAGAEEVPDAAITRNPSLYKFLELATRGGAEALGMGDEVGSLEPGKKADIITVNMNTPYLTPSRDPLTSIVLYGSPADIDMVIVDGNILKQHGVLTTIDMRQALSDAQLKCKKIIDHFFYDYPECERLWRQQVRYPKGRDV